MVRRRRIEVGMRVLAGTIVAIAGVILAAGCGSSHTAAPPTTTTTAGLSLTSPRVQQIALARNSSDLFSIFPAKPGVKPCAIPAGGVRFRPLHGYCRTSIRVGRTIEPRRVVSFTEVWSWPPCKDGRFCAIQRPSQHTWRVIEVEPMVPEGAGLRIAATWQGGSTAPQYYK